MRAGARAGVVICDDHQIFGDALALLLSDRGYEVLACTADPADGVDAVARLAPDVYVSDLHFPTGDGVAAVEVALAASPSTRVVVLSGADDHTAPARAEAAGASAYVRKDHSAEHVVAAIEAVLRGDVVFDPPGAPRRATGGGNGTRRERRDVAAQLTPRELEVLDRLVQGQETARLASEMAIAYSTARTHIQNILTKLGVHSKLEAVAFATTQLGFPRSVLPDPPPPAPRRDRRPRRPTD